jgi:hypothetical protein
MDNDLDMKNRKQETKAGSKPASNASIDPERGYAVTEEKQKIKDLMDKQS